MLTCTKCNLHTTRKKVVPGVGPVTAKIYVLGEAPGLEEDLTGQPYVGSAGRLLNTLLKEVGLDRNDLFIDNIVHCRPVAPPNSGKQNRTPTADEVELCSCYFEEQVKVVKPSLILATGNVPLKYLLNDRGANITKHHGQFIFSTKYQCYITATFHPAAVLRRWEYRQFVVEDLQKAANFIQTGPAKVTTTQYTVCDTWAKVDNLLNELSKQVTFSFDVETTGLNFITDALLGIGFSWKEGTGYYLPLLSPGPKELWSIENWCKIKNTLQNIFANEALKIAHNGSFDGAFIRQWGISINHFGFDTHLAHHLLDENAQGMHGLKDLAKRYTDMGGYEQPLANYMKDHKLGHDMATVPTQILGEYCAADADCTFRLYNKFKILLSQEGKLGKLFKQLVMPLCNVLLDTRVRGVQVDPTYMQQLAVQFTAESTQAVKDAHLHAGQEFNLNSNKQLQDVLFTKLKLPALNPTKSGFSTDVETLKELEHKHPVVKAILKYRKVNKLLSTYVNGIEYDPQLRVHTDYNIAGTHTGRLSSSNPNLQNIPHESAIKNIFCAKEGYTLVQADLSQGEYRAWAHYADDQKMIADITRGFDVHKFVASTVFNIPEDQVTKEQRRNAKLVVFGLIYGRGVKSVAEGTGLSERQASKIVKTFFGLYPVAGNWLKSIVIEARQKKMLENIFGRRRRFVGFDSPDTCVQAQCERQAKNFLPQSTVADIVNWAAVRLAPIVAPYKSHLVLNVHDCLAYEVPDEYVDTVGKLLVQEMTKQITVNGIKFKVPLATDLKVGKHWE